MCLIIGSLFETIMLANYFLTGHFRNYLWAGLIGAFMAMTAMIFLILMIVSDTLGKIKRTEEEILYFNKKREYYGDDEWEA